MPTSLPSGSGSSGGTQVPVRVSGLLAALRLPGARSAAQGRSCLGLVAAGPLGLPLLGLRPTERGCGHLGCGDPWEAGAGRADPRGNVLQAENDLNEILVMAARVWAERTCAASRNGWQPVLLAPASLGSVCWPLFLHLLPSEEETEAPWRQEWGVPDQGGQEPFPAAQGSPSL